MKKYIYLIAIVVILLVGITVGVKFAGVLAGLLGAGAVISNQKDKIKQAEEEYKEAGDKDPEEIDSPSAGAEYIDDILSDISSDSRKHKKD